MNIIWFKTLLAAAVLLLLTACGGGGGDSVPAVESSDWDTMVWDKGEWK